jgi:hypothetical protein
MPLCHCCATRSAGGMRVVSGPLRVRMISATCEHGAPTGNVRTRTVTCEHEDRHMGACGSSHVSMRPPTGRVVAPKAPSTPQRPRHQRQLVQFTALGAVNAPRTVLPATRCGVYRSRRGQRPRDRATGGSLGTSPHRSGDVTAPLRHLTAPLPGARRQARTCGGPGHRVRSRRPMAAVVSAASGSFQQPHPSARGTC